MIAKWARVDYERFAILCKAFNDGGIGLCNQNIALQTHQKCQT